MDYGNEMPKIPLQLEREFDHLWVPSTPKFRNRDDQKTKVIAQLKLLGGTCQVAEGQKGKFLVVLCLYLLKFMILNEWINLHMNLYFLSLPWAL